MREPTRQGKGCLSSKSTDFPSWFCCSAKTLFATACQHWRNLKLQAPLSQLRRGTLWPLAKNCFPSGAA